MRASKLQIDPVLVSKETAAKLCSLDEAAIERLIGEGKLPIKFVEGETLIPYRALLIFAGVARWRYEEVS